MTNVQLTGSKWNSYQATMQTTTYKEDVSLERDFQKKLSNKTLNNGVIDKGKY